MSKGFKREPKIKKRLFLLELNYQDSRGNESNIAYEYLEIPRLNDSEFELAYCQMIVWQLLESDYKSEHINQVFALNKNGQESLFRLQIREVDKTGEELETIPPPTKKHHDAIVKAIQQKLKRLYGTNELNYTRMRLPVRSLVEFFKWSEQNEQDKTTNY